jgi:DNA-binding beta-propeller fold protein YncE
MPRRSVASKSAGVKRGTRLRGARFLLAAAVLSIAAGCYSTGQGPEPQANDLYFPVGILPSPGGHALYVVNSDFDLKYNGGTIEVYSLDDVRDVALRPFWSPDPSDSTDDPCFGLGPNPNVILYPGPCGPLDLNRPPDRGVPYGPIFRRAAKIGAFATDVVMACRPSDDLLLGGTADCTRGGTASIDGARLFVPVRGDRSLTFLDVDDDREGGEQTFKLECGQGGNSGSCSDAYRAGVDPGDNTRGLTLPAEPFGVAISDRGDALVLTHQASGSGSVSLFTNKDTEGRNTVIGAKPRLEYVLAGLPGSPTGIAALPTPGIDALLRFDEANYQPGFAITYRLRAQVDVLRFFDDSFGAPRRPYLQRSGAFGLPPTPSGSDSRDVAFETSPTSQRATCERECLAGPYAQCRAACEPLGDGERATCVDRCRYGEANTCMTECARIPIGAYVSNRFGSTVPGALIVGDVRAPNGAGSSETLNFYDAAPVSVGASRVIVGRVHDRRDPPGVFRPRVFIVCFDSRSIFVYDPAERRVDALIRTGRGPHALVMDPVHPIAYVGHFTDSYIGLIDLDQSHALFGTIVATIGIPTSPQGTK